MTEVGGRLGLGGAQFGMAYGATNSLPPPDDSELRRILDRAVRAGVVFIDTAPAYGDSESRLGRLIGGDPRFRIATKTVTLADVPAGKAGSAVREGLQRSLERLKRERLDLLSLHHVDALLRPDWPEIVDAMRDAKARHVATRIGVSLYDPADFDVAERLAPDVIQAPVNPLDRRFVDRSCLTRLSRQGIAVHARSIFLQGLLVAKPDAVPVFARRHPALAAWRAWLEKNHLSAEAACLAHALAQPAIEVAILGVASDADLAGLLAALPARDAVPGDFTASAPDLIDPRRWPAA